MKRSTGVFDGFCSAAELLSFKDTPGLDVSRAEGLFMDSLSFQMPRMTFCCMLQLERRSFTRVFFISVDELMHLKYYSFFSSPRGSQKYCNLLLSSVQINQNCFQIYSHGKDIKRRQEQKITQRQCATMLTCAAAMWHRNKTQQTSLNDKKEY